MSGKSDVEAAKFEVDMECAGVVSAGSDGPTSAVERIGIGGVVAGAGCCVGYTKPPPNLDVG
jgi:hypothetical protein